ncbi:MAG TPA: anti-sigma factor [Candidatus Limnocylindria bacterium]|jgi:anti-sigma-K factor RskA|nr:anti-sigma factor [Candidatus Limnocylindria bacterium]
MSLDRHPTEDLPAYALGALEASEIEVIDAHIARCAQCVRDLAQFGEALYEAAVVGAVRAEPRADLRTRIVLRHRGARASGAASWGARFVAFLTRPVPVAVPIVLALLLVVSFAFVGATRQQADEYARALAGVADGHVVALAATGANPDARGAVVIPKQGQPYLVVRLPAPPPGQAWEAWVLKPGPEAVPAGTSQAGGVFTLSLTASLGAGEGVAVTLEPASGSLQPTTQPVLAVDRT